MSDFAMYLCYFAAAVVFINWIMTISDSINNNEDNKNMNNEQQ